MPRRKTGARKKKERQKEIQKQIQAGSLAGAQHDLSKYPCNQEMVCQTCGERQKLRAFCYFCDAVQRVAPCAHCGRLKCVMQTGECLTPHKNGPKKGVVGMDMMGAICDFCEAWVCHNRVCIAQHGCECLLRQSEDPGSYAVQCTECDRDVWMQGGRFFKCSTCAKWLCSDDQMEHQASCQYIDGDTYHCISCSRLGNWTCLRCKICFCDSHVVGKINVAKKGEAMTCKRCRFELQETKGLSISARKHEFGRHKAGEGRDEGLSGYELWAASAAKGHADAGVTGAVVDDEEEGDDDDAEDDGDDDDDDDDDDDEEEEDDSDAGSEEPAAGGGAGGGAGAGAAKDDA